MKKSFNNNNVIWIRIIEMLVGSIVLSAAICLLCVMGPLKVGTFQRDVVLIVLPLAYILWNFYRLRKCYLALDGERMYFIANIIAVIIYASLSCGLYLGADYISNELLKKAYSWLFLTTYFMQFTRLGILPILSIGIFHVILLISVFVAPIGLGWIKQAKLEREIEMEELLERVPGRLEVNPLENKTLENENNSSEKEVKI